MRVVEQGDEERVINGQKIQKAGKLQRVPLAGYYTYIPMIVGLLIYFSHELDAT